jgi:hypothetical protein
MSTFQNEAEIQKWLEVELSTNEGLWDAIENTDYLDTAIVSSPAEKRLLESYRLCAASLPMLDLISADTNISLTKGEGLNPDLLLYAPETQSLVIVEIKNDSGATRNAGTELSAYAAEARSYVPFISDGDIANVIVSTKWPTLLRHSIFHEIFWMNRNIICLEPAEVNGHYKLKIKPISDFLDTSLTETVSPKYLGGYQLCLYDYELYGDAPNRERLDIYSPQMRAALDAIAATGNAQKGHGFAFLWKDKWSASLAPYSITIVNFAAFQSIERFIHEMGPKAELTQTQQKFIEIIIENSPQGQGQALEEIRKSGTRFLDKICQPRQEGFYSWGPLKDAMTGRPHELLAFRSWGKFSSAFHEKLAETYDAGQAATPPDCPHLGLQVVESLIDANHPFVDIAYMDWAIEDNEEDDFLD